MFYSRGLGIWGDVPRSNSRLRSVDLQVREHSKLNLARTSRLGFKSLGCLGLWVGCGSDRGFKLSTAMQMQTFGKQTAGHENRDPLHVRRKL